MASFQEYTYKKLKKDKKTNLSFQDYTESLLEKYENEEDIAPISELYGNQGGSRRFDDGTVIRSKEDKDGNILESDRVKFEPEEKKLDFFQLGSKIGDKKGFWNRVLDVPQAFLGTIADTGVGIVKGGAGLVEGVKDLGQYGVAGVAGLFGADEYAEEMKKKAQKNSVQDAFKGVDNWLDQYSVLGDTSDSITQGLGQVGTILLTGGLGSAGGLSVAGTTALTTGTMGLSSMGSGMSDAYNDNATDGEAFAYGLSKGAIDAGTELLFGGLGKAIGAVGLSKGISSADDMLARTLSSKISNQVAKNMVEFGVKASGEGFEELLAGAGNIVMKKLTYMDEKEWGELIEDENLLEQFVVGAVTSGMIQSGYIPATGNGSLKEANAKGTDFITGYTQNEQTVIDKLVEEEVKKQETDSKKLTKKEIGEIEKEVKNSLERGEIDIDKIESVIGGDLYTQYNDLAKESQEYEQLYKTKDIELSQEQRDRRDVLIEKNKKNPYETELISLKERLSQEIDTKTANDTFIRESYNEKGRRSKAFEADLTKYNEKEQEMVKKAIESGVLNDTRKTHDFVNLLAKLHSEKDINFDFTTNEALKESGFAIDGATINGLVVGSDIKLNINSQKALNTVVGHEITHVFESMPELYNEFKSVMKEYATTKGEYDSRFEAIKKLYEGRFEGTPEEIKAKLEREVVADLVGDYLFTDSNFINNLSTTKPNVFKRIYEEIKYFLKIATAGSKEAKQFEQVKKAFDKLYKDAKASNAVTDGEQGVDYSLSSIANTFFGDENMSANEFAKLDYKQTQGYKEYVEKVVNNYKQTRENFDESAVRSEIEKAIDGIVRVAIASKKAGYDILDSKEKRDIKDSKERLLFSSLEPNSDYFTSSDISTICDKRKNFAEIYDDIVRAEESKGVPNGKRFFDNVDNYFYIHKVLADKGLTQPCRQCYVESMRKNLSPMASAFLRLIRETDPNNKSNDQLYQQKGKSKGTLKTNNASLRERVLEILTEYGMSANDLTVETLSTEDGLAQLKITAPLVYEAFNSFYGQSKPKMPKSATPFRFGELTALLTDERGKIKQSVVDKINSTGGFRLQSYSDFQIQNYTDVLQVIFEAGTLGLTGHAYTKVPAFLEATEGTNLKRNISIFMYKDGNEWRIDRNDSFPYALEEIYDIVNADETGNTSIIAVSQNEDMSAWIMANDNVGYGIPFHKSGLKMGTVRDTIVREDGREIKGYSGTKDHTRQQTEVWAKTEGDHRALTKVKNGINIYEFWDFDNKANLSKEELIKKNVKAYIDACHKAGYLPKFREYVINNGKVLNSVLEYSKKLGYVSQDATIDDISFEYGGYQIPYGYYKFLGDFGMFTPDGKASPHDVLSLENYDFNKAVDFFANAEQLRRNEILQQFANGEERQKYRDSNLSAEELQEVIKKKRNEVVDEIVPNGSDIDYSLSGKNDIAPTGKYNVYGKDIALETVSETENVAPVAQEKTDLVQEVVQDTDELEELTDIAPMQEADAVEVLYSLEEQQQEKIAEIDNVVSEEDSTEPTELPTVESYDTKLENYRNALEGYRTAKATIETAYDEAISKKEAEYNALKRKDTKKASNLLTQIENLKLRKSNNVFNLDSKIAKVQETIDKLENGIPTKRQIYHRSIVDKIKNAFSSKGYDFDKVLETAKDKGTFSSVDNTPQRFIEKSLGYKEGQILNDLTINKVAQNETEGIKWLNSFTDKKAGLLAKISKEYGIKPRSKESASAQMYAEGFWVDDDGKFIKYGDEELAKDFPDVKVQENIKKLAKDNRIRKIYDETLEMINESRKRNLYPEIPRRNNYFLHFREMEDTFSKLGIPFNPNDIKLKDLPTDINGMTADLKPGQPYFASAKQRLGYKTTYDLVGGVERYLNSAKNQIYHIDDIQTLRALRNYIADTFGQAKGLESLDSMTEEEAMARIEEVYNSHLSTFAKFLNEEANVLAGKTSLTDRGLEGVIGRRGIQFLDTVNRQVGSNMVGGNISSALTNTVSMVQAFAKSNKFDATKAFAQTVSNKLGSIVGKTDGFAENSPMMIRRKGVERLTKTPWERVTDAGYLFMSAVDNVSSEFIVRAKFNELTRKGMSEQQAHIEADKWASRILGDRTLGQQPQLYNSKMLGLFTKFQLEVRNQLDSQFYDTIQEAKVSNEEIESRLVRNAKTSAKVASTFFQLAVLQHLFGKAFESVAGYNPAFDIVEALIQVFGLDDDDESEDTVLDNLEEGFLTLLGDLPYTSTLTGGRIPISSALPLEQFITGKDDYGNEKSRWETIKETAPYYLLPTGYGQLKKTTQGLAMFDDELPIAGSYTDSGNLRYSIEDTPANRLRSAIFGQYSSDEARDYFDNERMPLKEKQIAELVELDIPIKDYWKYREGLKEQDTLEEKFDYIAGLDLPVEKKNIMINNVVDRKEDVDLENYDDFADYDEFDFSVKNPEKYQFLQSNNISYDEYSSSKDAYDWFYKNPDKYPVAKAITSDVSVYREYVKAINEIEGEKDGKGNTISGSVKANVESYIFNELDIDYGQKALLFKSKYPKDDTYNYDIIEYLDSRDDVSYEDMVDILNVLGFTVGNDGTIY